MVWSNAPVLGIKPKLDLSLLPQFRVVNRSDDSRKPVRFGTRTAYLHAKDEIFRTVRSIDRVVDPGVSNSMNSNNGRRIDLRDLRARLHIKLLCSSDERGEEHCGNGPETDAVFSCFHGFVLHDINQDRLRAL